MILKSIIRPVSGPDGPFYVVTQVNGLDINVTLQIANLNNALDQAKTDQGGAISGNVVNVEIKTQTDA